MTLASGPGGKATSLGPGDSTRPVEKAVRGGQQTPAPDSGPEDSLREENRELRRALVFARDEINRGIEQADALAASGPEGGSRAD